MMYTRPFEDFDLSIDPNKSQHLPISIPSLTHLPRQQEDFNKYQITVCLLQLTSGILVSSEKMFIELITRLQVQFNVVCIQHFKIPWCQMVANTRSTSKQPAQGPLREAWRVVDSQFIQVFKNL